MKGLYPLEDFASAERDRKVAEIDPEALERARLEGYEDGYQNGWDDALKAGAERETQISEEFARNLQDLGFTYHEARAHVVTSVTGLLEDFLDVVFPPVIGEAICLQFLDAFGKEVEKLADTPVQILVSPNDAPVLEGLLADVASLPVKVIVEEALVVGQAYFKLGARELRVDLDHVIQSLRDALDAVREANAKVLKNE